MYKILSVLGFFLLIVGCAAGGPQSMVKTGNYAAAYSLVINDPQLTKDRRGVVDSILQATGGAKGEVYLRTVQSSIRFENNKNKIFFLQTLHHIYAALSDGLLSKNQVKVLHAELREALEKSIVNDPRLLEFDDLLGAFELPRDRVAIAHRTMDRLVANGVTDLSEFLPIYTIFKDSNDALSVEQSKAVMRGVIEKNLAILKEKKIDYASVSIYVAYVNIVGDHSIDLPIQEALARAVLSKREVEEVAKVFPEFSRKYLNARQIKFDLKTNGDEFLLGEIVDALSSVNEWIEVDVEAPRKFNLARLRINEQRTQPINNTEAISDPDFGTILMMPKNATAMIDYISTEYSLQWNFTIQDMQTKKSKHISGTQRHKKIECRNIRYQNVFGGVGVLYNFPNARVQRACEDGARVDFDKARTDVVHQIAKEINDILIAIDN